MRPTIAVVGGGISGLAAAHHLTQLAPPVRVVLLEAGARLGGVLETIRREGFVIESAADGFLTAPTVAVDLCNSLGLADELITASNAHRRAFVVRAGQLQPIPEGFVVLAPSRLGPLLSSPILSLQGKIRAGCEYFVPRRKSDADESLESFVCRRFGRELFERLAQPLAGSIYTADPQRLSIEATLPRFRQMERKHGSVIRSMLRSPRKRTPQADSGAQYGQFATLRSGLSALVARLADQLPDGCCALESPVDRLLPLTGNRWSVAVGAPHPRTLIVDGVILTVPAPQSARLLSPIDPVLARELWQIDYASCAVVALAYQREQIGHSLDGFGFVVPLVEQRMILSCSMSSVKYAGRAPEGTVLLRVFIGGACQNGLLQLPRRHLIELAKREVADLLGIRGEPLLETIVRHSRAMPQYHVGHLARVARIEHRLQNYPTLVLAGSAMYGVGLPSCIQSGQAAAARVTAMVTRCSEEAQRSRLPHSFQGRELVR